MNNWWYTHHKKGGEREPSHLQTKTKTKMDDVLWGNSHRAGQFTECDLFWKRLGFRWRRMKEYWSNWERSAIVLQPARRRKMLHSFLKV